MFSIEMICLLRPLSLSVNQNTYEYRNFLNYKLEDSNKLRDDIPAAFLTNEKFYGPRHSSRG
jgi:hypothetical protein